jgi:hypothetical protein
MITLQDFEPAVVGGIIPTRGRLQHEGAVMRCMTMVPSDRHVSPPAP